MGVCWPLVRCLKERDGGVRRFAEEAGLVTVVIVLFVVWLLLLLQIPCDAPPVPNRRCVETAVTPPSAAADLRRVWYQVPHP